MKKLILLTTFLFSLYSYSQSRKRDTLYFLINKKDTLIYRQLATKMNSYEGYVIRDEKKIVKEYKRSSTISGDDIEYAAFDAYAFSFNSKNDSIINKSFFDKLKIIRTRRKFLDTLKYFEKSWLEFIFIETKKCNEFTLKKVRPIISE